MSLYCPCANCANTEPLAICDNALLAAQMEAARAMPRHNVGIIVTVIAVVVFAVFSTLPSLHLSSCGL